MSMTNTALETALKGAISRLTTALATKDALNSLKLEGQTLAQITSLILQGTAANSTKLNGMTYEQIVTAITGDGSTVQSVQQALDAFIARRDNPNQVTAAQVGLGNVQNFGMASEAEALAGVAADKYMNPAVTKAVVDAAVSALIDAAPGTLDTLQELATALHDDPNIIDNLLSQIGTKETPAGAQSKADAAQAAATTAANLYTDGKVSDLASTVNGQISTLQTEVSAQFDSLVKSDVGLDLVDNFATADQAASEAGVAANLFMTPVGTKQAIVAQGDARFLGKTAKAVDSTLFDGQTLAQVIATAQAGVDMSEVVMTSDNFGQYSVTFNGPGGEPTTMLLDAALASLVATDEGQQILINTLQTFVANKATGAEVIAGVDDAKYVTSKAAAAAISKAVSDLVDAAPRTLDTLKELATALHDDPNIIDNLLSNIGTKLAADAQAVDSAKLEGQSLAQVLSQAQAQTSANATLLNGKTLSEVVAMSVAATDLTPYLEKTGVAADSAKLGGVVAADYATINYVDTALQALADAFNSEAALLGG